MIRTTTMVHDSEYTEELSNRSVTFVSAEGLISMYVAVTSQCDNSLLGESRIVVECLLADVVKLRTS